MKIRERNQKRPKYKKLNLEEMARRLTYVQICPINAKVTIEGAEETVTEDVD